MSRRHELTDKQWELIRELLPPRGGRGHPWVDHRKILNGLFWILNTGSPWRDLPERYGPWQTIYDRFCRWRRDGLFDRIIEALQIRLDKNGHIDWDLWCVDGSSIRAHKSASGAKKKKMTKSQQTTHWAAHEAVGAPKSIWYLTARELRSPSKLQLDKLTSQNTLKKS